jgi:hypothetical protein
MDARKQWETPPTAKQIEALRALGALNNNLGASAGQVAVRLGIETKAAGLRLSALSRINPPLVRCQRACRRLNLPSLYWLTEDGRRVLELERSQ